MPKTLTERVLTYTTNTVAAWNDYLDTTTHAHPLSYEEVEAWAWHRLQQQLKPTSRPRGKPSQPTKTGG